MLLYYFFLTIVYYAFFFLCDANEKQLFHKVECHSINPILLLIKLRKLKNFIFILKILLNKEKKTLLKLLKL